MSEKWCAGCGQFLPSTLFPSPDKYNLCSVCYMIEPEEYKVILKRFKSRICSQNNRAWKCPRDLTLEQWMACLWYWNYSCPVCGIKPDSILGLCVEHWINLRGNLEGTTATNILCLCPSCNNTKGKRLPDKWLHTKFGDDMASQILFKVNRYFEWIKKPRTWVKDSKHPFLVKVDKGEL